MASIALKTQLWYIFTTDRQENHSGYFYFLHIQLNGQQHLSREHTVHCRCHWLWPWGSRQVPLPGWPGSVGLECPEQSLPVPRAEELPSEALSDEGERAVFSQSLSNDVPSVPQGLSSLPDMEQPGWPGGGLGGKHSLCISPGEVHCTHN